jgi:signal transduction histidine kinase
MPWPSDGTNAPSLPSFLEGGGELGALMRAYDWGQTPLGEVASWPQSLRSAVSILLPSKAQIVLFWGPDLVTLYNDAYRPVFGGKHPGALGKPAREAWSEIWNSTLRDLFEGVLRTGEAFWASDRLFVLERHGYPEETFFDVSYDPVRDESGGVGGVFCIVSETTGRVLGERRLKALRDLAERNANATTPHEACALSLESFAGGTQDLTFGLMYLAGVDGAGPGLVCGSAGTAALQDAQHWPLADVLRTGEIAVVDVDPSWAPIPTGAWTRPATRAALIPIGSGSSPAGVLVAGLNPFRPFDEPYRGFLELLGGQVAAAIANAEAREQERRRAESLAQLDRAKTAFFSNVSHEFRTPLTLMLGPLEDTLADPEAVSSEGRQRLEVAHRNSLRLLKLVNALLDFSRIEAGRIEASYEPTDLPAFTAELASLFRSAVERAGMRLRVDCPPLDEPAYVDREMWEKIVFNLLSNAFKYTFEGEIEVAVRREGGQVALRVRDTGTGIPPEERAHLFERFHRVKGARGRTLEGTGIGLALVLELVKLHGGRVEVESEVGRGSTFTVTLPLGRAHLPADRIGAARARVSTTLGGGNYVQELLSWLPAAPPGLAGDAGIGEAVRGPAGPLPRILLADDNADVREYVRVLLAQRYEVEAVGNGLAALEAARARRPDLVLTDVMMPGLDGFELLRELRADERLRSVPVMMLSARAGEEARVEGLQAGADDYLVKPFSARELHAHVSARLELSRLHAELQREIRQSEQRYRHIFETAGVAIWEEDFSAVKAELDALRRSGVEDFRRHFAEHPEWVRRARAMVRVVDVNQTAVRLFGARDKSELTGPLERIVAPDAEPAFAGELLALAEGRPRFESEASMRTLAGDRLDILLTVVYPATDPDLRSVLVTFTDITARKRAEEAVRDADRRKDEFLATLSHELRNPLAPLRNSLHLLRVVGDGAGSAAGILERMERQLHHLVRLVDDLLEVSRISRGTFELRRERVDVAACVRSALETSDPLIQAARHAIHVSLPEAPVWVDGDPVRLAQIVANLLNNAAKYTNPGGVIAVQVRAEDGAAVVSVRDNGSGIAPEILPHIFEMFRRGERASGRDQGGLGIGLALAQRLAEMHGGEVSGASDGPGKGSEFTVRVPLAAGQGLHSTERPHARLAMPARRMLVVDDNRDSAESMSLLLESLGASVRVALDGDAALEAFESYDPAVVLLDIGMPGMDGYEVARRMRARFPDRRTMIVALTGWGQEDDRRRAREAGFDHHLVKPANLSALQALLASLQGPAAS